MVNIRETRVLVVNVDEPEVEVVPLEPPRNFLTGMKFFWSG